MNRTFASTVSCITLLLLVAASGVAAQEPPAAPVEKAPPAAAAPATIAGPFVKEVKIIVDKKAKSNGEIRLSVEPEGGTATEVRVTVQKGMGKQDVCRDLAKELSVALGPNFDVKHYDDDKIKITQKGKALFRLGIAGQTVTGLSLELK